MTGNAWRKNMQDNASKQQRIKILKVDIKVPENYIKILKRNLKVEATTSAFDEKFFGKIETISSRVDPTTRSILVQAKIDNKSQKLIPGMLININLIFCNKDQLNLRNKTEF